MSLEVASFDNPQVLVIPTIGVQRLYVCSGVAIVDFAGNGADWRRDDLAFFVPQGPGGVPNQRGQSFGDYIGSTVVVTLATFDNNGSANAGGLVHLVGRSHGQ